MDRKQRDAEQINLTVVVPLYNEEENTPLLYERIRSVADQLDSRCEFIFINDGSTDGTLAQLQKIQEADPAVVVIDLRRNFGQTAALSAGFDHARGDLIVAMDGDLQNDPADIPKLIEKLNEGYDVVSGWRADRKDNFLRRKLPSMLANGLISWVTGVHLHDYGCTLKVYRRELIRELRLYGEMHRFIPALASWRGARVGEIPVMHHPRAYGVSKYGISRTFRVILDLITVKFILSYSTRPLQIFGLGGLASFALGGAILVWQVTRKLFEANYHMADKPIVLAGVLLVILGVQLISMGLLAELQIRTYHESQNKPTYTIRSVLQTRRSESP